MSIDRGSAGVASPYRAELEAEERGWYALADMVRSLSPDERMLPGYYRDPDWSVRDLVGHLGTWLAEAATQMERIAAGKGSWLKTSSTAPLR